MSDFVKIEYSNSVDLGDIMYHNSFRNRIYIDADVSKPEYEIEEDGIEDADGEFDPTLQKWAKKYTLTFYAQEFLVDALTLMAIHDQIYVTLKNDESSQVLDVEVDYTWDGTIECWAEVVIKFTTEYIIKRNCDTGLQDGCIDPVHTSGYTVQDLDGAGAGNWTDPGDNDISDGEIMFFYVTYSSGQYYGDADNAVGFYKLVSGSWVLLDMDDGQYGEVSSPLAIYLVKCGVVFNEVPFIFNITDEGGGDAKIYAISGCVETEFFQVQYDDGGGWSDIGDPAPASSFIAGYTVSPGAGVDIDFRISWYNHSCDYGTGNEATQTIT